MPPLLTTQQQCLVSWPLAVGKGKGKTLGFCSMRWGSLWGHQVLVLISQGWGSSWRLEEWQEPSCFVLTLQQGGGFLLPSSPGCSVPAVLGIGDGDRGKEQWERRVGPEQQGGV